MSLSSSTVGGKIKYKIVLLGDQHVGKTSIIDRFINDRFEPNYCVEMMIVRPPSVLIFWSEILLIIISTTGCRFGTLLVSSASKVSFPATSRTLIYAF